jgi:predicted ATP-grasp superfamily ATP-dependent carboligase
LGDWPIQRIFVYEYVTGGGTLGHPIRQMPSGSLLREGCSMVTALAADLIDIPKTEVTLLRDARLPDLPTPQCQQVLIHGAEEERTQFQRLASSADRTIVIAPEIAGALADRCRWVEASGGRLASPDSRFVSCAGNKTQTADLLRSAGLPVPDSRPVVRGEPLPADFSYPAVLKPNDGAGSVGIQRIADPNDPYDTTALEADGRLEAYRPGCSASVALLCGPAGKTSLPPCTQRLTEDGRFRYLGGETPLRKGLSERARSLAVASIDCLPPALGYVGVDLVLGAAGDGSQDVVIEVNPRLTTSYIGLRRLLKTNLAWAMLRVADGRDVELSFACRHVKFDV